MGNPFMPSVATSLNQAGGMTLQSLLEQRLVQQEMAAQQQKLQQQALMDQMSLGLRLRGDQRAQGTADLARQRFVFDQEQDRAKAKAAQLKVDAEAREARNIAGARDIFATGVQNGADPRDLTRAALDGKVPVSMMPKPERTLADKVAEVEALTAARERTKAKFPRPTKAAKDDPELPAGVKSAIDAKRGQPGWGSATEAARSLMKSWPSFRAAHPGIDQDKVRAYIANLYGERLTPTMVDGQDKSFILGGDEARAAAVGRAAQAKSLHR